MPMPEWLTKANAAIYQIRDVEEAANCFGEHVAKSLLSGDTLIDRLQEISDDIDEFKQDISTAILSHPEPDEVAAKEDV